MTTKNELKETYNDRMTLNRLQFENMLKQQEKAVKYGWTSSNLNKRFIKRLITNIHEMALRENKILCSCITISSYHFTKKRLQETPPALVSGIVSCVTSAIDEMTRNNKDNLPDYKWRNQ